MRKGIEWHLAAWIDAVAHKFSRGALTQSANEPPYLDDLRRCILLCRTCRKAAVRTGDWHREIFAEEQLRKARKLYRVERAKLASQHLL